MANSQAFAPGSEPITHGTDYRSFKPSSSGTTGQKSPTKAAYNIRIAPNKTRNPVIADPRHIRSNVAMMPSAG
jgi:hypothetical protein